MAGCALIKGSQFVTLKQNVWVSISLSDAHINLNRDTCLGGPHLEQRVALAELIWGSQADSCWSTVGFVDLEPWQEQTTFCNMLGNSSSKSTSVFSLLDRYGMLAFSQLIGGQGSWRCSFPKHAAARGVLFAVRSQVDLATLQLFAHFLYPGCKKHGKFICWLLLVGPGYRIYAFVCCLVANGNRLTAGWLDWLLCKGWWPRCSQKGPVRRGWGPP